MVNPSAQSLLAQFVDSDDYDLDLDITRNFSPKREQTSKARFATSMRHNRKRSAGSPSGPRRKLRRA